MVAAISACVKKNNVYVLSPDQKVWDWLVKEAGKGIRIKRIYRPYKRNASLLLLCCDYKCRRENCSRKFLFALRNENMPFGIIRPTVLSNRRSNLPKYLIEIFSRAIVSSIGGHEENPMVISFLRDHSSYESKHLILRMQKWVIDNHGKIDSVARLKSELGISNRQSLSFIAETNLHLKTYINKIRMCHAFWNIISSGEAVKSVAYEFGFDPKSFSRKFHGIFGVWPSEVHVRIRTSPLAKIGGDKI